MIEQHTAKVNDTTIAYLQAGSGFPLVLLHGFPQHSHMWRKVIPMLSEHFTVIAPDQRGMGGSSVSASGYDKRSLAVDMHSLVRDVLGYDQINLLGYDQGAGTAYAYAAAHRDEVVRLAFSEFVFPGFGYEEFIAPKRGWNDNWQLVAFTVPEICHHFMSGREEDLLSWYFYINADKPSIVTPEEFNTYVRALRRPGVLRAGFEYFAAVWDDADNNKESAAEGKLTMPVIHIGGEKAVAKYGAQSAEGLAENVRSVVVPDAGHWLVDEQPEAFSQAIIRFMQG